MPVALNLLARAAGADGAVLVRQGPESVLGYQLSAEVEETVTHYVRSDRPPDPTCDTCQPPARRRLPHRQRRLHIG
jgi:hypothetical protein